MSFQKLVRDKIPEIIAQKGGTPVTRILGAEEYKAELEKKLLEECREAIDASREDRTEEMADILEVIMALAASDGKSLDDLIKIAEAKKQERGGFSERIYLEDVK